MSASAHGSGAAADGAASDRDLAEAIYAEIVADNSVVVALDLWRQRLIGDSDLAGMRVLLAAVAASAIEAVLARRLSEAARTGPWDGSILAGTNPGDTPATTGQPRSSMVEDDSYPGSPPPRGKP